MGLPREKLPVLEEFISIQGEGTNMGLPYYFIRVGGCPLRCRFCDSEYTWTVQKETIDHPIGVAERAMAACDQHHIDWISITGGEPLLYPMQLKDMMLLWRKQSKYELKVHIETSGRYYDESVHGMSHLWSMDIKTPCTNETNGDDLKHLKRMRSSDQVKCLIEDEIDLEFAKRVHGLLGGRCVLVLQPFNMNVNDVGPDKALILLEQYHWLVDQVLGGQWANTMVSPQLHVLTFGNVPAT